MQHFVYADNAATTRLLPAVLDRMMPFLTQEYGNPSSMYGFGQTAHQAVEQARNTIAACLHCRADEVFFTSGGSEADNWAIKQAAHLLLKKGKKHIISTAFEHHAVLHTLQSLQKEGFEVTLLPVYQNGIVRAEDVQAAIRPDTALVSVMYANNEIGTVQPIAEIGAICRQNGVWFHTDAVQAVGHLPIDFEGENIDLLSLSGHKFHGPKGVGALIMRKGIRLPAYIDGGAQEKGRRAGTENTAGIVGMAAALEIACRDMEQNNAHLIAYRDAVISSLLSVVPRSRLNGDAQKRLPSNINISFEGIEGESLLLLLDAHGICASSGSACTSGSLDPSHVLLSIGLQHAVAHGSLRLSLGEDVSEQDVQHIIETVPQVVAYLRQISPLWEEIIKNQ